ncbi:MAG TPA: RNA polymerase sigma factor [Polyangiales bacterium]|jgi:RNA polymerase sigma-70 factor (ECF subfamily)|nr:RNA polymerase sigma factor [Polyangiales bacterium]
MLGTQPLPPEHLGAEALFRAYAGFIAGFLVRMGVPFAELDDLVQEVFLVALRKGGYYRGPAQPRTWLSAIALRVAQASRRTRNTRNMRETPDSDALDLLPLAASDEGERLDARRRVQKVQHALSSLADEHRAAFLLYELEGESCESIAAAWNVPVGTVYSRLHYARRRFLQAYNALSLAPSDEPQPNAVQR